MLSYGDIVNNRNSLLSQTIEQLSRVRDSQHFPYLRNVKLSLVTAVEAFRIGYPRFAALIGAHPALHICRRFSTVRARLMLQQQDQIAVLEKELQEVDSEETRELFLNNLRRDGNAKRKEILGKLHIALAEYGTPERNTFLGLSKSFQRRQHHYEYAHEEIDTMVERNVRMLSLGPASQRNISSLRNWVDGNNCLVRSEKAFLWQDSDLLSISTHQDGAMTRLEPLIENFLMLFDRGPGTVRDLLKPSPKGIPFIRTIT